MKNRNQILPLDVIYGLIPILIGLPKYKKAETYFKVCFNNDQRSIENLMRQNI